MLAFEISINGIKQCLAGVEGAGVVSSVLTRVRHDAAHSQEELELTVIGRQSQSGQAAEILRWLNQTLNAGDTLTIRILEVSSSDEPAQREWEDPRRQEKHERAYYEQMKQKYEP